MRKASSKPINMSKQDHEWFESLDSGPLVKAAMSTPKRTSAVNRQQPKGNMPTGKLTAKASGRCK